MVHITKTSGLVQVCFPHKNTLWVLINFTLFGPIGELKLSNRSRAAIPGVCDFEFAQQILRHIIFSQGIHYKTLVSCRSITWPILGTFFTAHFPLFGLKSIKNIYKLYFVTKIVLTYCEKNCSKSVTSVCRPKMRRDAGVNAVFFQEKRQRSLQRLSSFSGDERTLHF